MLWLDVAPQVFIEKVFWETVRRVLGPTPVEPLHPELYRSLENLAFEWVPSNARYETDQSSSRPVITVPVAGEPGL
jgi:hypothetical protein